MKLHAKIALGISAIGLVGIVVWRLLDPVLTEKQQALVSDVGEKGSIHLAVDGWVGYFPLCSPEMKRRLNREGYGLRCTDDAADYQSRFSKLKNNDYQFVVATVDSYLLNGEKLHYPGPIVAVIDESKGGDAIVSWKSEIPNLEALKNAQSLRVAFTPDSPSHHLLKAVATHFDIDAFKNKANFIQADGSSAALSLLQDKKADIAVLWEPDVSKALADSNIVRLLGTEDTQQLIVDILIASQKTAKNEPAMVSEFLRAYFKTLKFYRDNPEQLAKDMSEHYDINKKTAAALLHGVSWATLVDNAERWYGVGGSTRQALIDTIESAKDILLENKNFTRSPIPNEDPYRLIFSGFVETLYHDIGQIGSFNNGTAANAEQSTFKALTSAQWNQLVDVGSLKTRNITFSSGTSELTLDGKKQIDALIQDLNHYPTFRVEIRGHTGLRGDVDANQMLSQERADAVLRYIEISQSNDKNRFRAKGLGSSRPLQQKPGESDRSYNYRLPRVEIALVREVI